MKSNNALLQAIAIVVVALVCAVVANGFAGRQRQLKLPGYYPDARRVPPRNPDLVPPPARTETATPTPAPITLTTTSTQSTTTTMTPPVATPPIATNVQSPAVATTTTAAVKPTSAPPPPVPAQMKPSRTFEPHPDMAYIEIAGNDVAYLHSQGALFLDARRTSAYEQGHIADARPFSVWESDVDDKVAALFNERSDPTQQNLPIVIYCSGGDCEDSHMLAQKLWGAQFNNIYVYKDGFPDWQKRGGKVRTGSAP